VDGVLRVIVTRRWWVGEEEVRAATECDESDEIAGVGNGRL
jgi:hypothetical protein